MMNAGHRSIGVILLLSVLSSFVTAQTGLKQQVLSTFIYTNYGDRTPFVLPTPGTLTPLGAQQLFKAGATIRDRYLTPTATDSASTTISGISPFQLQYNQLTVLATQEQYITGSAHAFLQGLYPPLETFSNYTYIEGQSTIQNGTNLVGPLNGYQYPDILTMTSNDLNSIYLDGSQNCPSWRASTNDYYRTDAYESLRNSTQSFYNSLQSRFLDGHFPSPSSGYLDAYYIYDYLNYANIHNTTAAALLEPEELTKAKILAADWVFALNADVDASGPTEGDHIRAIAGRTLASRILQSIYTTVNTQGQSDKMTLLFGSFEPMVAFAALSGLVSPQNAAFYSLPEPGSSFIFQLTSLQSESDIGYPDNDEIYVEFLYQNGTGSDSKLVAYPLFGLSPSQTMIPLTDFISNLEKFIVFNVEEWCNTCNSFAVFCPAFTDNDGTDGTLNPSTRASSANKGGLSPAVAGVVGAVVTLAVALLLFGAVALFGGVRLHRVHRKRRSELGGFKGSERLASDQDLTIPKGGAGAVVIPSPDPVQVRGHERVGSWELKNQAKAEQLEGRVLDTNARPRRPSYEDDDLPIGPYTPAVDAKDQV